MRQTHQAVRALAQNAGFKGQIGDPNGVALGIKFFVHGDGAARIVARDGIGAVHDNGRGRRWSVHAR